MSRYAKPNVTIDELRQRIEDAGGIYELLYSNPSQRIVDDMAKIEFDCENVSDEDEFDMPGFEAGYDILPNGVAVDWVAAGGDWEDALALCIYIGHDNCLRVYIPKDGNCYNFKTKAAFGNWDGGDEFDENPDEDYGEYEDECECDHHFDEMKHFGIKYHFDMDKLRAAAAKRIIFN